MCAAANNKSCDVTILNVVTNREMVRMGRKGRTSLSCYTYSFSYFVDVYFLGAREFLSDYSRSSLASGILEHSMSKTAMYV
jgi:hypothetical protein